MSSPVDAMAFTFSSGKIRCVLAHDHVLLRQALRRILEDQPDIDVVGEAGNAAECLREVYEFRPDVVVVDERTMGLPADEAERSFSRESPNTKIVFLSTKPSDSFPSSSAAEGCNVRQTSAEGLVEMVRNSCGSNRGKFSDVGASKPPRADDCHTPGRSLTAREREVLKLLAEGKTVRTAATVLGLSSKTVDSHKFNLMRKLGIHNKAELVIWAIQKKVLKMPVNF